MTSSWGGGLVPGEERRVGGPYLTYRAAADDLPMYAAMLVKLGLGSEYGVRIRRVPGDRAGFIVVLALRGQGV